MRDYQELNKVTGNKEAVVKKDLNFCMGKYMEGIKKSNANGQAAKPTATKPVVPQKKGPIIQEMPTSKPSDFKKVNIIEDDSSEDSDDLMEAEKQKSDALKAKKEAEEAALQRAKEKAILDAKKSVMTKPVPKSATGFEQDLRAFKNDKVAMVGYLHSIPIWTLEGYFKKAEVPAQVLSSILGAFSEGRANKKSAEFLLSLAKGENFDMTLMFAEASDKKNIENIVETLTKES